MHISVVDIIIYMTSERIAKLSAPLNTAVHT